MQTLSIGELAERSGAASQAIRFYEKEKLMPPPRRTDANYRRYPLEAVDRLQFIVHAKQWGFTLDEIPELLILQDANGDRAQAKRIADENEASGSSDAEGSAPPSPRRACRCYASSSSSATARSSCSTPLACCRRMRTS